MAHEHVNVAASVAAASPMGASTRNLHAKSFQDLGPLDRARKVLRSTSLRLLMVQVLFVDLVCMFTTLALNNACGDFAQGWDDGLNKTEIALLAAFLLYHILFLWAVGWRAYWKARMLLPEVTLVLVALIVKVATIAGSKSNSAAPFGLILAFFILVTVLRVRKLILASKAMRVKKQELQAVTRKAFALASAAKPSVDAAIAAANDEASKKAGGATFTAAELGSLAQLLDVVLTQVHADGSTVREDGSLYV